MRSGCSPLSLGFSRQRAGVALVQNLKAAMRCDGGWWVEGGSGIHQDYDPGLSPVTATMTRANMAITAPPKWWFGCVALAGCDRLPVWRLVDQSLPTTSFGVVAAERIFRAGLSPAWADPT